MKCDFEKILNIPVFLIAMFTLFAWAFNPSLFLFFGPIAVNPLTAICLLVNIISLFSSQNYKTLMLNLVIVCVSLVLYDYVFVENLNLDRILFASKLGNNHMAPNTAVCLLLITFAKISNRKSPIFPITVFLLAGIALLGYFSILGQIGYFIPMAFLTAVALLFSSLAQLFSKK